MDISTLYNGFKNLMKNKELVKKYGITGVDFEEEGDNHFVVNIGDKFALYSITVECYDDGTFDMYSRIIETAYEEVDEIIGLGDDLDEIGVASSDFKSDMDINEAISEICAMAMDDGSLEHVFKELNKMKTKIDKLYDEDEDIANNNMLLSKFLLNMGYYYE